MTIPWPASMIWLGKCQGEMIGFWCPSVPTGIGRDTLLKTQDWQAGLSKKPDRCEAAHTASGPKLRIRKSH
jgi:hypothetical protein